MWEPTHWIGTNPLSRNWQCMEVCHWSPMRVLHNCWATRCSGAIVPTSVRKEFIMSGTMLASTRVYPLIPNTTVVPTNWYCDMHSSSLASYLNSAKKSATYPFFLLPKTSPNNLIKTTPGCLSWEIWDWSICFLIDPLQVKNQGPIWRFYPLNDKN